MAVPLAKKPGVCRLMLKGPDSYLAEQGADGAPHFAGVCIPVQDQRSFVAELRALAWSVVEP